MNVAFEMKYIQARKNRRGKYEVFYRGTTNRPQNDATGELFEGEFETPHIARATYQAWYMKQHS